MAGVSTRTLHYYDQIGLLRPSRSEENGYRRYTEPDLLRLQQILYYRELGFSLGEIRHFLDNPNYDQLTALQQHHQALQRRQVQLGRLIETIEKTIAYLKGNLKMESSQLFAGFSDEQQKQYEEEIRQKYGSAKVDESRQRWGSYTAEQKQKILEEGGQIYLDLVEPIPLGPASPEAQQGIARWHAHLRNFYEPTPEILLGLGDAYNDEPAFAKFFARIHPELSRFMREAIQIYCQNLRSA